MIFCIKHNPMMLKNTPEHKLVHGVRLFTPIIHIFTPRVLLWGHRSIWICGPTSGHNCPTGGLLAHWSSSVGPRGTARSASCRSAPPLGRTDLPVPLVAHSPETVPDRGAAALRAAGGGHSARQTCPCLRRLSACSLITRTRKSPVKSFRSASLRVHR